MTHNTNPPTDNATPILPCPFCGETDIQVIKPENWLTQAYCDNCGASSSACSREGQSVELWNTRAETHTHEGWVKIEKMSPLLKVPSSPNEGYVDIANKRGSRFPDATWVVETGTNRRGYWRSASGHEISEPAYFRLPPEPPK